MESKLLVEGIPPLPLERELTVVGESLNRRDGIEKVTGRAKYSGDVSLPGMLYGKILRCPHPRARIRKIDTSEAENLPGVKALLTKDNTAGWRTYWYVVPQIAFPECITYEGQEVAAVAAEDADIARKALELIEVEYDILHPMTDAEATLKGPIPDRVADEEYPGSDLFDRKQYVIRRGDMKKGFEQADLVIEETYTTHPQYHGTIQTRACIANWDGQTLTVWDALQGVWNSKKTLALSLGLAPEKVRVIVQYLGGGFGSKSSAQRISFYAARLSMVTERPVKMELTRREEFLAHPRRQDCKITFKMGAKRDGTLTAIFQRAVVNVGAGASKANYFANRIIWTTSHLYACPNAYLEQIGVFTNLQLTGPQRGPLNMPAIFALESHIDKMADALDMDPLAFRLKNYANYGITPPAVALLSEEEEKIPYSVKNLDECMKLVAERIGWQDKRRSKTGNRGPLKRGVGMASFVANQGVGMNPFAANADIEIDHDGSIRLYVGVVDIGAGQLTILPMIAAEELGVEVDDIEVLGGDTKDTRYAPSGHASRITPEMGPAVLQAAAEARNQLFRLAAPLLEAKVEDLQSLTGQIFVKSEPDRSMSFKDACHRIEPRKPVIGRGSRRSNPDYPMFATFGAQAVELEVDIETGAINILKVVAAHDFGRAINPKLCVSQIYGGIEFGLGYALTEEGLFDPRTGKLLNPSLHQYRVPTSLDIPPIDAHLIEHEDAYFAYSAKGAGENTNTPTPAAIRNAIYDAVGVWLTELPITPDKIIQALKQKKETEALR